MLTNPVIISVVLMSALCLAKFPVLLALLVSAIVAGLTAGIPLGEVMGTLVGGMGGNANTALSYILLGTLAACFTQTGAAAMIAKKFSRVAGDRKFVLLGIFLVTSMLSQNLIPVHIALHSYSCSTTSISNEQDEDGQKNGSYHLWFRS